ncbi:M15 family metallopeptidase [Bacillus sp. FJAT-42315]|uniref:M15 family metallopeptidase n=1 Tax=Bacillus sp. FJAT-42315 TaxID=2014077 RepID=UPI001E3823B9|nr:M15 family metallopeptidase [Bacillus sp. FJAT-42315]
MKKWGFILLLALCLSFAIINVGQSQNGDRGIFEVFQGDAIKEEQIHQGNLLLVNDNYPIKEESIKSDIVNLFKHKDLVIGYELSDSEIKLSEDVAQRFSEMVSAAANDGIHHFVLNSGFRSFDKQRRLYEEKGSQYALPPGYSEHNLGLSLDVGSTQMKMSEAPEGEWLENNAWKYGFILRYPKNKTDITGIEYEPWHIRYVGLPHSVIMKENNFVLEEYLNYLKEEKNVAGMVNGKEYTVTYYSVSEFMNIKLSENQTYEISGNNVDGVILTTFSTI